MASYRGFLVSLLGMASLLKSAHAIPAPQEGSRITNSTSRIQQSNAPWNLQRISSRETVKLVNNNVTALAYTYEYDQAAMGAGVDVYIVDSGVDVKHPDFGGRAKMIFKIDPTVEGDGGGHGTIAAGVVGSSTYGIAKNVNILGASINFGGDQDIVNSTKAINAVLANHNERRKQSNFKGSVMNLSWGFDRKGIELSNAAGFSGFDNNTLDGLKTALRKASEAGIHITIAPGNDGADACDNFPATYVQEIPSLISVGNSDITDTRAKNSDWGRCVDLHAPGTDITSTWLLTGGYKGFKVDSGTSFAAPAVAGVIAGELVRRPDLMLKTREMKEHILAMGIRGAVKDAERGGNILLHAGF
ncbi:Cerevisin [Orbilia brochopaga]|nr:Cerevisin [Drechslerella brochopaga]